MIGGILSSGTYAGHESDDRYRSTYERSASGRDRDSIRGMQYLLDRNGADAYTNVPSIVEGGTQ